MKAKARYFLLLAVMITAFAGCASYTGSIPGVPLAKGLGTNSNITHYDVDYGNSGAMPDFRGTIVRICFSGNVADKAKMQLLRLGARDFVEGHTDTKGIPMIQVSIEKTRVSQVNDAYYQGYLYVVPVHIKLIRKDGSGILLGSTERPVFNDSAPISGGGMINWSWNSRYGVTPLGSPELASGLSAERGIKTLLNGDGWLPGAYEAVRAEFHQSFLRRDKEK